MSLGRVTLTDFHFKRSDHFDLVSWSIKVRGAPFETHGIDHFQLTDGVKLLSTNPSHITPVTTSNVLVWGLNQTETSYLGELLARPKLRLVRSYQDCSNSRFCLLCILVNAWLPSLCSAQGDWGEPRACCSEHLLCLHCRRADDRSRSLLKRRGRSFLLQSILATCQTYVSTTRFLLTDAWEAAFTAACCGDSLSTSACSCSTCFDCKHGPGWTLSSSNR